MALLWGRPEQNTVCSGELQPSAPRYVRNQLLQTCLNKPETGQKQNNGGDDMFSSPNASKPVAALVFVTKPARGQGTLWGGFSWELLAGTEQLGAAEGAAVAREELPQQEGCWPGFLGVGVQDQPWPLCPPRVQGHVLPRSAGPSQQGPPDSLGSSGSSSWLAVRQTGGTLAGVVGAGLEGWSCCES